MSASPALAAPLVLVGPTASGKSAVALELARRRARTGRPVELVSCDSMAVYRGMDVGTATPGAAARAEVPHHLLDVVDPDQEFHVARFAELVVEALDGIAARGAAAVLVGGTGLYVQAVVDGLAVPGRWPEVAQQIEAEPDTDALRRRLEALDPLAASRIPAGNRRRLVRALEVTIGSGRPFSASGPGLDAYPPTRFRLAGLAVPRDELGPRIAARYRAQLDDGFLDEVRALLDGPGWSRTAREALGYRELAAHLTGDTELDDALTLAVTRTRRFAVRQERWFRRDPRITWFAAPDAPGDAERAAAALRTPADVAADLDRWWDAEPAPEAGPPCPSAAPAGQEPGAGPAAPTGSVGAATTTTPRGTR